jgi:hypothetical protein
VWIADNKKLGVEGIAQSLSAQYEVSDAVKKEIQKLIK